MTLCVSFDCICNYYFANVHTFLTYFTEIMIVKNASYQENDTTHCHFIILM